jgi:hypothetical protein
MLLVRLLLLPYPNYMYYYWIGDYHSDYYEGAFLQVTNTLSISTVSSVCMVQQ